MSEDSDENGMVHDVPEQVRSEHLGSEGGGACSLSFSPPSRWITSPLTPPNRNDLALVQYKCHVICGRGPGHDEAI